MKKSSAAHLDVDMLLDKVASKTAALIANEFLSDPLLVGIKTGGVWVAN